MSVSMAVVSPTGSYQTITDAAASGARTKGDPELFASLLVIPFDSYEDADDHVLIYKADQVRSTASAASTDIAAVNFTEGQIIYWDNAVGKITNVATGNTPCGRSLEKRDYSGGVSKGDTLDFELDPNIRLLNYPLAGVAAGYKVARGQHTTATASDTVATGLASVVAVTVSLEDDPGDDPMLVSAKVGDQAGAPVAGSILIKTWKNTGGTDPTPAAATTFNKKVNWIAVGT